MGSIGPAEIHDRRLSIVHRRPWPPDPVNFRCCSTSLELPRRNAGLPSRSTVTTARLDSNLISWQTHIVEDGAISGNQQRQGLRASRQLRMGGIEIILKRDVLSKEVVRQYLSFQPS